MEEDNEVLDWGNEEEDQHQDSLSNGPPMEDADDAVSLGDEEDEQAFYTNDAPPSVKSVDGDSGEHSSFTISQEMNVDPQQDCRQEDKSDSQSGSTSQSHTSNQKDSPKRLQPLLQPRLTHALPPKPIASTLPYIPPSHPSIVEATAMSARARDHKRSTGSGEKTTHYKEPLPSDWEIRYPRSGGRTFYYYNAVTHQSTWYHPGFSPPPNRPKTGSNPSKLPPATNHGSSGLSYDDRHYRPGSPEVRHEDRMHSGPDLRPAERGYTPPRSPRLRSRARSASPVPVPVIQRQASAELRGRTRSSHSSHNADVKGEFSDLARDRDIPLVDSSESRWVTSSKGYNNPSGHTNREARHMQHSSVGMTEHAGPAIEDRPMISRSHSARGHNRDRERELHSSAEGRQELNHGQNLSASRHHSPPPHHDREWIPAQRDQRGSEFIQQPSIVSAKVESNSRAASASAAHRRDRPSRFDQPLTTTAPPAIIPGPSITTERSHSRPRERNVFVPNDTNGPYGRPAERDRERDFLTPSSHQMPIDDGQYTDDRPTFAEHQPDWQQAVPVNSEYAAPASDQPGPSPRRRRAPLPPQATSFRKDSRKRDLEPPRLPAARPPPPQASVPFPTGPADDKRREDVRTSPMEPHNRQEFIPRNQRAIYDGTDRHVSREPRGHPSDFHRPGPAGHVPKLTGPNSVPIGTRRQIGPSHDAGSRLPEAVPPPLQSPVRNLKPLPPLPPGKESYERPVYDVKAAVDSYRTVQQDVSGSSQRRQRNSSPPHKRDYPLEPPSPAFTSPNEGLRPRERSRFDQPSREGRVPQSYERPLLDLPARSQPPLQEPILPRDVREGLHADRQLSNPAVESLEPPKSPHAKLLAAKEKLERFAEEDRLRRQEQQKAQTDRTSHPKPSSVGLLSAVDERQRAVEQEISYLRLQEPKTNPEELERYRLSHSPSRFLTNREPMPPVRLEPQRRLEYGASLDLVRNERSAEGQKQIPPLPVESDYSPHLQRLPERARPSDVAPVNTPLPGERRTKWGELLQIAGASDALARPSTERPDGHGQRPGQGDRYEPNYGESFSGVPHRQRRPPPPPPPPRSAKEGAQLGRPSRPSETLQGVSQMREYEKARPGPRPLLDRLSLDAPQMSPNEPPSLWDRVQIPEKRDRNEMDHGFPMDTYEAEVVGGGASEPAVKRARRRNNKPRRARRGGAAP